MPPSFLKGKDMDEAKKAALLSALLFPGWGQIYLKHYKRGLIFLISVLIGTISLAIAVILSGMAVIKTAPFQKGTVQFADVIRVCMKSFDTIDLKFFLLMILLLVLLWILSVIDAYQLGKKMASKATTAEDPVSISDRT